MIEKHIFSNRQTFLELSILESPHEVIEGRHHTSKLADSTSILCSGVVITSTWYSRDKCQNTHGHEIVGCWDPLNLALSVQTVKEEFHFYLFPDIGIDQVMPPSGNDIFIMLSKLLGGKLNPVISMPIELMEQHKAPVITNFLSLITSLQFCQFQTRTHFMVIKQVNIIIIIYLQ